ncbi:hypothetical protein BGZ80_004866 [Entomortierella chlamydospora]|uniref:GH16 domain-containing protein n=1 Tax=Entomortierella chlamydospora TaxID=101097 RepID=A0A9P6MM17_9FUNG|nr:hypothetical protein BGZ79_006281 [Entomortierella chlamydospora]KAG0007276.1 hypothetical protein BGZ80_004866 [Entomortierella chlamydospora]
MGNVHFRWMLYGTVSTRIKLGSPSGGVVSSFIYRNSMIGDEIDYEWHTSASMDPKDIDYSNSRRKNLVRDLSQNYQTYTIEWFPDKITWLVNGQVVRILLRSDVNGTKFSSSPSQIQFSIWDGGFSNPETEAWPGDPTDWSDAHAYTRCMSIGWISNAMIQLTQQRHPGRQRIKDSKDLLTRAIKRS